MAAEGNEIEVEQKLEDVEEEYYEEEEEYYEDGESEYKERRSNRNRENVNIPKGQMGDIFDKLPMDDVESLKKTLHGLKNNKKRNGQNDRRSGNQNRAAEIGLKLASRCKDLERQLEDRKESEAVFSQLRSQYEETSSLNEKFQEELQQLVDDLTRENTHLKEFISSQGLTAPEVPKRTNDGKKGKGGKGKGGKGKGK